MLTIQQKRLILNELEAIAGKYNFAYKFRGGIKQYVWRKTVKGRRAGDWHVLVMADKARDLGCEVTLCKPFISYRFGSGKYIPVTCPERLATAISVYLPDSA